jgi:hypothetical protein
MKHFITILLLFSIQFTYSQEIISQELYEGQVGKMKVSIYLKIGLSDCGPQFVDAVFTTDKNTENSWKLLRSTFVEGKEEYTFVEHLNTGVFLLTREDGRLKGIWISSDGKKTKKVVLNIQPITAKEIEYLEEKLDLAWHDVNDC